MPGGDQTGPRGGAASQGRGFGYRTGYGRRGHPVPGTAQEYAFRFRRGNRSGSRGSEPGRGRMGGPLAAGPGGYCICPSCGHKEEHVAGKPCNQQKCPKCGVQMTRE
jgi:hypothetical protein